jgi:perosamine synthetase
MLGWNYRMTEMDAALGVVQFGRLDDLNGERIRLAGYLTKGLGEIDGIEPPVVWPDAKHVYYFYALKYVEQKTGIPRDLFVKAINAEGIPFGAGYVRPLYLSSLYHDKRPFAFEHYKGSATYDKGLCPTTENLHENLLMQTLVVRPPATTADMNDIVAAFHKVVEQKESLVHRYFVQHASR